MNNNNNSNENFYQFQTAGDKNQVNNQNMNNNNSNENFYQFQTVGDKNQTNNQNIIGNDPLGVSSDKLIYEPGIFDEQIINKVFQMPTRIMGGLIAMGAIAAVGLIILIIGLTGEDKDIYTFLGGMCVFCGGAFSAIFIPILMRNKKMTQSVNRDFIRQELGKPHYYLKAAKTYFTENYVISLFSNKIISRYYDIVWIYDEPRNQGNQGALGAALNLGLGNTNIVLVLNDQKKYRFPSCNENSGIYTIISCQNNNVIMGKTRESKEAYNQYKNYSNNMNQQMNNYNNMNQQNGSNQNNMNNNMYNNQMNNGNNYQGRN